MIRNPVRRVLQDPLLHFLLLGGGVFALHAGTREPSPGRAEIVIPAAEVRRLASAFEQARRRPPTDGELAGLVEERVREEVFFREALAAGLDEDDGVLRRRLARKLEFLVDDIAGQAAPAEQELQAFLDAHPERFRAEPRTTFRHVCFRSDQRADAEADARAALAEDGAPEGDRLLMVGASFEDAPRREVARVFGDRFAEELAALPVGEWAGPVRSGYGWHLVLVASRSEGEAPALADVRDAVAREWAAARRDELNDALYEKLRAKYAVVVEER